MAWIYFPYLPLVLTEVMLLAETNRHPGSAMPGLRRRDDGKRLIIGQLQLGVDYFDFLFQGSDVFFDAIHLALHVAQQRVAALGLGVEEAQIVFIGLQLAATLLEGAYQALALAVELVVIAGDVVDIVFKFIEAGATLADVKLVVELVDDAWNTS